MKIVATSEDSPAIVIFVFVVSLTYILRVNLKETEKMQKPSKCTSYTFYLFSLYIYSDD